jgi:hypothetical protein
MFVEHELGEPAAECLHRLFVMRFPHHDIDVARCTRLTKPTAMPCAPMSTNCTLASSRAAITSDGSIIVPAWGCILAKDRHRDRLVASAAAWSIFSRISIGGS